MLNSNNFEHGSEKYVRWIIPIGLVGLGVMFFNKIAGFLTTTFNSMTDLFTSVIGAAGSFAAMVVVVLAVGLPILYVLQNPAVVSMWWRGICRKITGAFIKLDPLSFMDSFVEKLIEKRGNLQRVKTMLEGKKIKLERKINELMKAVDRNMKEAVAAKNLGKNDHAAMLSRKAKIDTESVRMFQPMLDRMNKYITWFDKLVENWGIQIEGTKYEIDQKRIEYEMIKEMHKGLSAAEIFANSDNEQVQIFQMSVKALEESVTQKIAYIDDFEKRSKSMMDGIDIERQMMTDDGLRMLEEFERNGETVFFQNTRTVDGEVTVLSSTPYKNPDIQKLLRK